MELEKLLKMRRTVQGGVARIQTAINKNDTTRLTSFEISAHFKKLTSLNKEAYQLETDISILVSDEEQTTHETVFTALNSKIMELKVILVDFQKNANDMPIQSAKSDVRLPKLELPKFSGNIQEWVSFHDLFVAAVDSNNSLTGAQKLQYLKASLEGQAATVISAFQISNANYDESWKMLVKRFQHTRELVFSILDRLFNQPNQSQEYSLRKLIDTTNECIRTLTVLNQPTDEWDAVIVFTITGKLDSPTRREWEIHLTSNDIPEYSTMEVFLESRARALSATGKSNDSSSSKSNQPDHKAKHSKTTASHYGAVTTKLTCVICNEDHPLFRCKKFLTLSVQDRIATAKKNCLCLNCLRHGHFASACTSGSCKTCKKKHNTLLHLEEKKSTQQSDSNSVCPSSQSVHLGSRMSESQVLLSTAVVKITDSTGNRQLVRALLDSGSQASFITEECAQRLGIKRSRANTTINGLSSAGVATARSKVHLTMSPCVNSTFRMYVEALLLSKITSLLPDSSFDVSHWTHIQNLKLADPKFNEPRHIDLLLDVVHELTLPQKFSKF